MTDLHELAKRLEAATGPDRWWLTDDLDDWCRAIFGPKWTLEDWGILRDALGGSLDAAVALCERVLPNSQDEGRPWLQILQGVCTDDGSDQLPRLICLALIRCLIAKAERP